MPNDNTIWVLEYVNGARAVLQHSHRHHASTIKDTHPDVKVVPYEPRRELIYPQWVSVFDFLPPMEEGLRVLVYTADAKINGAQFFDIEVKDLFLKEDDPFIQAITHWALRPFPSVIR